MSPLFIEPIVDLTESEFAAEETPEESEESEEEIALTPVELRLRAFENYMITLEVLDQGPSHDFYQQIVKSIEQFEID